MKVEFTGVIKGLSVKATESTPTVTLTIEALGGLTSKAQALIDTMSDGSLVISMTPAQSSLKFGEKPEGVVIDHGDAERKISEKVKTGQLKPPVPKRVRRKSELKG